MSCKLLCCLLLAVACFGIVNSVPGFVNTAFACDSSGLDCQTDSSNGPVMACDGADCP